PPPRKCRGTLLLGNPSVNAPPRHRHGPLGAGAARRAVGRIQDRIAHGLRPRNATLWSAWVQTVLSISRVCLATPSRPTVTVTGCEPVPFPPLQQALSILIWMRRVRTTATECRPL